MLSPSETAPVCNGGQLKVTCTTTGSFLRWNITLVESEIIPNTYERTFTSTGLNAMREPVVVNSTIISFIRTSAKGESPLISKLLVNPISRTFNGSRVKCIELPLGRSESTVVHVMDFDYRCKYGYSCMKISLIT